MATPFEVDINLNAVAADGTIRVGADPRWPVGTHVLVHDSDAEYEGTAVVERVNHPAGLAYLRLE